MPRPPKLQLCTSALCLVLASGSAGCRVYEGRQLGPSTGADGGRSEDASPAGESDAGDAGAEPSAPPRDAAPHDPESCLWGECWWSKGGGDTCQSVSAPTVDDRPEGDDDVTRVSDIYLGLTQLRLGSTNRDGEQTEDAWEDFGLDLDGVCTNSATCTGQDAVSCKAMGPEIPFDGQLCRDNTFARLQPVVAAVPELGNRFGLSEEAFNCELWRGGFNMILRISGYSGEPDDPQVRVDLYTSNGIQEELAWQCPDPQYRQRPRWLSSRKWGIDESWLSEPITEEGKLPDSMFADQNAYVRNGYLVAEMPEGARQGFVGGTTPYRGFMFTTRRMMFLGHLYRMQNGTWSMRDGLSAGSIGKDDLVRAFREIGFCEDGELHTFYESMLTYVEENADLLGSGEVDPTAPCDAMSFAIGFQAAQLTPGTGVTVPPPIECCPPGKTAEQCLAKCGDGIVNGDETCDTAISEGETGACPTRCAPTDACTPQIVTGAACASECTPMPITMVGAKDGCCPRGGNGTTDADCEAVCGNGVVESGETCDPPGSCAPCTPANACTPRAATGSAANCNLRCEAQPITSCDDGDRCCPNGCSAVDDDDCSATCGNQTIEMGETCENGTDRPCDTRCDDGDACTSDASTGSPANCNVACTHEPITQPVSGDGCCPDGATANSDADCEASCGNQTVEGDEQCDDGNTTAGDGCFECRAETQEQICFATLGADDACAQCTCNRCAGQALGCYGNANATEVRLCGDMVDCARRTGCGDPDCYCGNNPLFSCLLIGGDGPCQREVSGAAKTDSLIDIDARSDNLNFPIGRANALGDCVAANCAAECGR